MGIAVAPSERYEESIRKLFPQGGYWDRQFADPESDASLFARAKLQELLRFRRRMSGLHDESRIETSSDLLENWERVLLDTINHGLDSDQRKGLLLAVGADSFNIETIRQAGRVFGITVTDAIFPFRPAFFGHSRFGIDRIASPAVFSVLFIYASQPADEETRKDFESHLLSIILSNYIVHFIYGGLNGGDVS